MSSTAYLVACIPGDDQRKQSLSEAIGAHTNQLVQEGVWAVISPMPIKELFGSLRSHLAQEDPLFVADLHQTETQDIPLGVWLLNNLREANISR